MAVPCMASAERLTLFDTFVQYYLFLSTTMVEYILPEDPIIIHKYYYHHKKEYHKYDMAD